MKKTFLCLISLILVLSSLLSFTACQTEEPPATEEPTGTETTAAPTEEETTEEETTAEETTEALLTDAPTDPVTDATEMEKSGCGASASFAALALISLAAPLVFKKRSYVK